MIDDTLLLQPSLGMFSPASGGGGETPEIELLTEDGSYLSTEVGDSLITEG